LSAPAERARWAPGTRVWHGRYTGLWWAFVPGRPDLLVEAPDPQQLARKLDSIARHLDRVASLAVKTPALVTAAVVLTYLAPLPSAVAAVAKVPSWKPAKLTGLSDYDNLNGIVATGRNRAWVIGDHGGNGPFGYHWDGRAWRRSTLPKGLATSNSHTGSDGTIESVSASGSTNAWTAVQGPIDWKVFDQYPKPDCPTPERRRMSTSALRAAASSQSIFKDYKLLRWNGKRWVLAKILPHTGISAVVATGTHAVDAFGYGPAGSVRWHFNGKQWKSSAVPFSVTDARAQGRVIWAVGESTAGQVLGRFDGRTWKTVPLGLPATKAASKDRPGIYVDLTSFAVLGKNRVSISAMVSPLSLCGGGEPTSTTHQLTWDGRVLKDTRSPYWVITSEAPDGHGGSYALAQRSLTGPQPLEPTFLHRTATGIWKRAKLPRKPYALQSLAHIPGTTELWATGSTDERPAILRYA
jgi:hypothetical protein